MKFVDRYPIVVTPRKNECRDFWVRYLGLGVLFDSSWFCLLGTEGGSAKASNAGPMSIAFMTPDHPSSPPGPESFAGPGLCFDIQVEDATAAYRQVLGTGLQPSLPLTREPWGQLRFGFTDPSGLFVDVVEQVEPEPGFWDRHPG